MKFIKLNQYINQGNTLLGIGVISKNCVDASIDIANEYDIPIMLIASRRQIDDKNIKRGYVNNWSTEEFSDYVRNRQKKDNIILARDHGGPWQNNIEIEKKLSIKDAMAFAKESYTKDIDAGFDILHIDPSIDIHNIISFDDVFDRLMSLYEFCFDYAIKKGKNIEFEIGTEEQTTDISSLQDFSYMIDKVCSFCNNYKIPLFSVLQIGTKVIETQNIGVLNSPDCTKYFNNIKELTQYAKNMGINIKIHNTDYLNPEILRMFPSLNIAAANVAPEFGVYETKAFINLLENHKQYDICREFLELAYNSRKWGKWVINDYLINREKAILAGHYVFSSEKFLKLKENAQKQIKDYNIDVYLKNAVKDNILNYINCFTNIKKEILMK